RLRQGDVGEEAEDDQDSAGEKDLVAELRQPKGVDKRLEEIHRLGLCGRATRFSYLAAGLFRRLSTALSPRGGSSRLCGSLDRSLGAADTRLAQHLQDRKSVV